ncbi:MAG: peptidoglycan D,D-transpeptidase FtsI family protein [Planctomycetota bacterium]
MQRRRIYALAFVLLLLFGGVVSRLVWLQVYASDHFRINAEITSRSLRYLPPVRGNIFDRYGQPLAVEVPSHDLVFTLKDLERARAVANRVARTLALADPQPAASLATEQLYFELQGIRLQIRPYLTSSTPPPAFSWIRGLSDPRAAALEAAIARRPTDYPGIELVAGEDGTDVRLSAALFAGERAVLAAAQSLGIADPHAFFAEAVWLPYLEARREPNLTARQWAFEEERVLARDIPFAVVLAISLQPEEYPGLLVRPSTRREYPGRSTLAQLTGYLGPRPAGSPGPGGDVGLHPPQRGINDIRTFLALRSASLLSQRYVGVAGLERILEPRLCGEPGARIFEVDRFRRESPAPLQEAAMIPGESVQLTIDLELSRAMESMLTARGVKAGCALVGVPGTGEVLGWCSLPSFDLADRSSWGSALADPRAPMLDRPSQGQVPPGSTFKPVLAVGALQEGLVSPAEIVTCTGYFDPLHRDRLRCPNHGFAVADIDLRQSLARSCNYYYYELGKNRLHGAGIARWAHWFGFGRPTGIGLPERPGTVGVRHAESASIGKGGITTTPLQLLRFTMALANQGELPWLRVIQDSPLLPPERVPADPWVWRLVREGMRDTVRRRDGTASDPAYGLTRFDCAVKTGTAGIGRSDRNIAWIIGYAPVAAPQVAFVVEIEDTDQHGGEAAAPVAADILDWLQHHRQYALEEAGQDR